MAKRESRHIVVIETNFIPDDIHTIKIPNGHMLSSKYQYDLFEELFDTFIENVTIQPFNQSAGGMFMQEVELMQTSIPRLIKDPKLSRAGGSSKIKKTVHEWIINSTNPKIAPLKQLMLKNSYTLTSNASPSFFTDWQKGRVVDDDDKNTFTPIISFCIGERK